MKGLAIYLIIICAVVIFLGMGNFTFSGSWNMYQALIALLYLIGAIVFLSRKEKYSGSNKACALLALIISCLIIVWDTYIRCSILEQGDSIGGFLGRITVIFGLLYIPAIVFSSIIIDRNRRHITIIEKQTEKVI